MNSSPTFRRARRGDLEAIVAMFADDELGKAREDASLPLNHRYTDAFDAIADDPNQYLLVGEMGGDLVAYLQITFIPQLSRLGSRRGQLESVRVASRCRGQGIGTALSREAIRICRDNGCALVQLTTDRQRQQTRAFYERLGFVTSHHGMKLVFESL